MATVRVDGADRLASGLRRAADQLTDTAATAARAGRTVQTRATGTAPRRTGRLAASHTVTVRVISIERSKKLHPVDTDGRGNTRGDLRILD